MVVNVTRSEQQIRTTRLSGAASVFLLHSLAFAVLAWLSWRKWSDPIVDFGRELYVPWQITQGKVLYRDIASLFGPLSPYVNALWMRLFGVSLMTIAWCNMAIFAGILAAVYRLLHQCTDRYTATCATLMALLICGFSQYVDVGNYNFVTPYAHEATHGFALSVLTLLIAHHAVVTRRSLFGATAGLTFGLSLLTKPELPVAVAAAVAVGFIALAVVDASARRFLAITTLWFAVGSLIGPMLFFAYFRQHMDTAATLKGIAAGWIAASNSAVTSNLFYLQGMGMDAPLHNAALMIVMFLATAAFITVFFVLSRGGSNRRSFVGVVMHTASIGMIGVAPIAQAQPIGRALPLVALAAVLIAAAELGKNQRNRERAVQMLGLLMWAIFALVLLGKIGLSARIFHYGFYLALPAMTVGVVLICWALPEYVHLLGGRTLHSDYRLLAAILLTISAFPYLALSYQWHKAKTIPMGYGSDLFYASEVAGLEDKFAADALSDLKRRVRPGDTIAVLPEGVMLNYLLRVESPLRVVNLMPPEYLTFGEADVVRSLEARPPTLIVFAHKHTLEYGYPLFGTSPAYGRMTMDWIQKRYRSVRIFGIEPTTPSGRGFEIFERM